MRMRGLLTTLAAATAMSAPAIAAAEPGPPPPPPPGPNINAWELVKPSAYAVNDGSLYAFTTPGDITCVMSRGTGGYGCSGPFPGAPNGANVVSGGQAGAPGFASAANPIYVGDKPPQPLPPNSRISFQHVSCGTDGVLTSCQNSFDQSGFVIGPGGSYVLNATNPLLDRPEGRNPYFN
ncbi:hypothetical protein K0O62_04850 [Mycolicibacterium diernhoferi]|uniref:Secreted protein n=2 Tax=Mycolicibacterium diernhoferi TaxID=1801 RepID=A0A1Q4HC87_9MYCO|nr:hypothetical protein [Mycolicibacterium diernhoferi]OJZ65138.1 hypothetical protein BRW64_15020 [Mycolicibacterium diernhoferi]OPE51330.1 hypothetical protein BV510_19685 [Mycolicibacterium diernhoferi]PEG55066.1 hypothetical protein CRI78_07605 [Mycolicibacterium diernhoferi]QYL23651.1 hypothetical protein K0O62_04850 [Mycolicibacterium diernhoferi]